MSFALLILAATAAEPDPVAVQAVHSYSACIVGETPQGARELLALDFRTEEYRRKLRSVVKGHDRCVSAGARLGAGGVLFAGAMAEALLKSDIKSTELSTRLANDPQREAIAARSEVETMALCTVMKAPQASAALFSTSPASKEELEAMQDLQPVLADCLQQGAKLESNRPALRSILALAAWRIATAARRSAE